MLNPTDLRRAVYRRGSTPGQVDHPGWLSKVVADVLQLEQALADGWQLDMQDAPAPREDVPEAVPAGEDVSPDAPVPRPRRKFRA